MKRAFYDARPKALEAVGNGDYLYHWDIQEETVQTMQGGSEDPVTERTQYSCLEAVIHGDPTYDKCVEAVIRNNYTSDEELAMLNKYNSYQTGIIADDSIVTEYEQYLQFVAATKEMARKDFGIGQTGGISPGLPRMTDIVRLMAMTINTMTLTDTQSLSVKSLYPEWSADSVHVKQGEKYQYNGKLYEVVQNHTTQSNWSPENQSSLWVEVVEDHKGTLEDPIPYNEELNPMWQGMILEEGKYYTQNGVIYKCIRGTGNKVTHNLADLVSGGFVQKVEA